jgi:FkbH-like protein
MQATISPVNDFTRPRVAQLTQRSNQFNLRTIRYTDEEVKEVMFNPDYVTITVTLSDKYGDYGLISAVFLKKISIDTLFIDTWIMSCRVLKRGVENAVLNEIVIRAKEQGFSFIEAEYLPTQKNGMVKEHYLQLGFMKAEPEGRYRLAVHAYNEKEHSIHRVAERDSSMA